MNNPFPSTIETSASSNDDKDLLTVLNDRKIHSPRIPHDYKVGDSYITIDMEPRPQFLLKVTYGGVKQIGMPHIERTRFTFVVNNDEPVIIEVFDMHNMEKPIVHKELDLFVLQDHKPHNIMLHASSLYQEPIILMVVLTG
jgi:hypothetical protein